MTCPLCQYRFDEGASRACSKCPLAGSCGLICCPACGYQFAQDSACLAWLRRIFRRRSRPVSTLEAGAQSADPSGGRR